MVARASPKAAASLIPLLREGGTGRPGEPFHGRRASGARAWAVPEDAGEFGETEGAEDTADAEGTEGAEDAAFNSVIEA